MTPQTSATVAEGLARFASGLDYAAIPSHVIDRIKILIVDQLGIAHFVARSTPWGEIMTEHAEAWAYPTGTSEIIGSRKRTSPQVAALANGTFAMGYEFEDMHVRGAGHPFSIVFPAALAAATISGISGREFLTALVAGYEAEVRSSLAVDIDVPPWTERGVYPITTFGVIGAAVAASRALSLSAEATANAIGIAGAQAFGIMQAHSEGSMARRMHAGRAAEIGVSAALLAERGFTGPLSVVEGEFGIYNAFGTARSPDASYFLDGLGRDWATEGAWLKHYPCNGMFQAPLDALLALVREHDLTAENVAHIDATIPLVSRLHARQSTGSSVRAQFSLHYCLAQALAHRGVTVSMFHGAGLSSPAVDDIMSRIDVSLAVGFDREVPGATRPGVVRVTTRHGDTLVRRVDFPKGHPRNPMSVLDVREKFHDLMSGVAPMDQTVGLHELIRNLDLQDRVPVFTVGGDQ